MRVDVLTIFPEMFEAPMSTSIMRIARDKGLLELHIHDLREWTHDAHRTTDDTPYGGGPGMVMKPEPLVEAIRAIAALDPVAPHVVFLAPVGIVFDHTAAEELATTDRLLFVCGRYEGFDERVFAYADQVLSIGDYVLTGGELAAMVVTDAVVRLLPGVLGDDESSGEESFSEGLLEYPQYTRPASFEGLDVPTVLREGNHALISSWRREQSLRRTARHRPDLLDRVTLNDHDRTIVDDELKRSRTHD